MIVAFCKKSFIKKSNCFFNINNNPIKKKGVVTNNNNCKLICGFKMFKKDIISIYLSTSPKTISWVPIIVTTSAKSKFLDINSILAKWTNPGDLIRHLEGFLEESEIKPTPNSPFGVSTPI
jgi:hypothetical protein